MSISILPIIDSPDEPSPCDLAVAAAHAPRTFRTVTLGCKANQYETQLVKEGLERWGFREVGEAEPAALCVVNTCTVTSESDSKARQLVRQLARQNPGGQTILFGCYAVRDPQALAGLPNVSAVVTDPRELPDVFQRFGVWDWPTGISRFDGHRRAFVKVQDGCLLRCTYCIIPFVRPRLSSRSPDEIVDEVSRLVDHGFAEIVLTGIHLGHFGVDTTRGKSGQPPFRLRHLVRRLNDIPGMFRLRLSSLESNEVDEAFIADIAGCEKVVPHWHLCLQSGSDSVLARMRRRYRSQRFLDTVEQMRSVLDRAAFSTDVIVGFPGETETEFEETLAVCEQARFMKIHAFPFSPRKGTPAASFPNPVPGDVQRARMARLAELEARLATDYARSLIGTRLDVLVEARPSPKPGHVRGTACRYLAADIPGTPADIGRLIPTRVLTASATEVVCERLD